MVLVGDTVKLFPVCKAIPPVEAANHSTVVDGLLTVSVAEFPEQMVALLTIGASGIGFTVTVTGVRVLEQPAAVF